ncbi:hypothetical protein, partial [Escherichia coli]
MPVCPRREKTRAGGAERGRAHAPPLSLRGRSDGGFCFFGTVAKLAMRQPFVLFKGLTFQKLCLP